MPNFRTEINIPHSQYQINHSTPSVLVGSCFTENMGNKLQQGKLPTTINPFGILYNPLSVLACLQSVEANNVFVENDLLQHNGKYLSLLHHGSFSSTDKKEGLQNINNAIQQAHKVLPEAAFLFITFGTAWVFEWNETGKVVGNCHKIPANRFTKRLLSVQEIVAGYKTFLENLLSAYPQLNVVFTISPIRHWKNGAIDNQRSKSILNVAVHELVDEFERCSYFPAYELLMDDLRDYRFYAEDMLHPNKQAIDYVWEKFSNCFFGEETQKLLQQIKAIQTSLAHKPFDVNSGKHQQFLNKALHQILKIEKSNGLNFEQEKQLISQQLV